jgi:hypothetical protein
VGGFEIRRERPSPVRQREERCEVCEPVGDHGPILHPGRRGRGPAIAARCGADRWAERGAFTVSSPKVLGKRPLDVNTG